MFLAKLQALRECVIFHIFYSFIKQQSLCRTCVPLSISFFYYACLLKEFVAEETEGMMIQKDKASY
jgi:hypothetical protein